MFNIVLVNPQIHTNTGSIGRMCVNSGCELHLVAPFGFEIDDKHLRRAGLDYWQKLSPRIYANLEEFLAQNLQFQERFFFATTKSNKTLYEAEFQAGDFLFFGSETSGLPLELMRLRREGCVSIPMTDAGRSLNLATSVGIVTYEAIRQNLTKFDFRKNVEEII